MSESTEPEAKADVALKSVQKAFNDWVKGTKEHPESYCHLCGGKNITWYVSNELWNAIVGDGGAGILCPICFVRMAEKKGIVPTAWRLSREGDSAEVDELRIQLVEQATEIEQLKRKLNNCVCPRCGRCPVCGRGGYPPCNPPYYPPYVTWTTSTDSTSTPIPGGADFYSRCY